MIALRGRSSFRLGAISLRGIRDAALALIRLELVLAAAILLLPASLDRNVRYVAIGAIVFALAGVYIKAWDRTPWKSWAAYVLGWVLFSSLRAHAGASTMSLHTAYPIDAGSWLLRGNDLTVWLQRHLYHPGGAGPLDMAAGLAVISAFILPHVAAYLLWRRGSPVFPLFVTSVVVTLATALIINFVVPTAPPWRAGLTGELSQVTRILTDVTQRANPYVYRHTYGWFSANDAASMPAVSVALAWLVMLLCWRHDTVLRAIAAVYALFVCFAVVYLGEHYLVDVVAGIAIPSVVWWFAGIEERIRAKEDAARRRDVESLLSLQQARPNENDFLRAALRPRLQPASPAEEPPAQKRHLPGLPAIVREFAPLLALAFAVMAGVTLVAPTGSTRVAVAGGTETFDGYMYRTDGARADPVNLVFRFTGVPAGTDAVVAAVQQVLGWSDTDGSEMGFVDRGHAVGTARHLGVQLVSGQRLHMRVEAVTDADGKFYVLAGVHRDDPVDCGHVGRATDEMRDFVARAFLRAGYTLQVLALGNTDPGAHCDDSHPVSDGHAVAIDIPPNPASSR